MPIVAIWLALEAPAAAAESGEAKGAERPTGAVNWQGQVMTATGSGAPDLKAPNVAAARLGAERVAKLDALRNLLEQVKGVRVTGSVTAGESFASNPELKSKVEGVLKNFKVTDTRYFSDGGVEVVVQVPMDGVLVQTLVPEVGTRQAQGGADDKTTGVVVNATGLGAQPSLAPRLVDESGAEIYGPAVATTEAVARHGVVGYAKGVDEATRSSRVAGSPLVVKAMKVAAPGSSDLVIAKADAARIRAASKALASANVVIVTE